MSLRRSLRRVPTAEALNDGLEGALVEENNCWRKMEKRNREEAGLSMMDTYIQVYIELDLRLRYFEAL